MRAVYGQTNAPTARVYTVYKAGMRRSERENKNPSLLVTSFEVKNTRLDFNFSMKQFFSLRLESRNSFGDSFVQLCLSFYFFFLFFDFLASLQRRFAGI